MIADEEAEDGNGLGIGLSFIDLVSGGFGAAFFLFLLFVTLPITVIEAGGGGDQYLDIRLEWQGNVRLEPIIGFTPVDGFVERYLRISGPGMGYDAVLGEVNGGGSPFWRDLFIFGYAGSGQDRMRLVGGAPTRTATLLRLIQPCPGRYRVFVNPIGVYAQGFSLNARYNSVYSLSLRIADDGGAREESRDEVPIEVGRRSGDFRAPASTREGPSSAVDIEGLTDPDGGFDVEAEATGATSLCGGR